MSTEQVETAARAAYVEMEWARRITEHDSDRRTDAEYKERAGTHWDDGHAGYSMYRRYRRQAAAVLAAIHPTVSTETELDALPVGSVILADGETWRRVYDGATHSVWHGGRHGYECAQDVICPESSATVLHIPGGAA